MEAGSRRTQSTRSSCDASSMRLAFPTTAMISVAKLWTVIGATAPGLLHVSDDGVTEAYLNRADRRGAIGLILAAGRLAA